MKPSKQKELVLRHAQLMAGIAADSSDESLKEEACKIEHELDMNAQQIAQIAIRSYLSDY